MSISREFLGWSEPCLRLAARYLAERYGSSCGIDLHEIGIVLPGGRAIRRLTELLVDEAEARHTPLMLPRRMVTAGELPELLYAPSIPAADDLSELMAWRRALETTPSDELVALTTRLPQKNDYRGWFALAETLAGVWRTLAAGGVRFSAVAEAAERVELFEEHERWQVLSAVFSRYQTQLQQAGLSDLQLNRIEALEREALSTTSPLILIAGSDLHPLFRKMVEHSRGEILSLVFAPKSYTAYFDACGVLVKEAWSKENAEIEDKHLFVGEGAESQARLCGAALASFDARYSVEEITMGAGDPLLVPYLEQELQALGVAGRSSSGRSLADTAVVKLLGAVGRFVASNSFASLAALLRHTDFEALLRTQEALPEDALTILDEYQRRHLQGRLEGEIPSDRRSGTVVKELVSAVKKYLTPFLCRSIAVQDLVVPVQQLIGSLYGARNLQRALPADREIIESSEALREELEAFAALSPELSGKLPPAEALSLLVRRISKRCLTPDPANVAIEIVGWLELQLDDAPALVITGMHEGSVPESINADPFLPDALRRELGLLDNEGRYARDVFAFKSICASRSDVRIVVGKRSVRGEPLLPGRLLLAGEDSRLVARIQRLYGEGSDWTSVPLTSGPAPRAQSAFTIPPHPAPLAAPLSALPVTAFADYLTCPYRFYLKHVLHLERLSDQLHEMEPDVYGALAHGVFARFGNSAVALSAQSAEIAEYLLTELRRDASKVFGTHPLPAVLVQLQQLEARMKRFAEAQAAHRSFGWRIAATEVDVGCEKTPLMIDGKPFVLRGRVDRIDLKGEGTSQQVAIIDYKFGETASAPEHAHGGGKKPWKDLQLPLYHHLVRHRNDKAWQGEISLCYALLPKDLDATGFAFAQWNDADLKSAVECAYQVIREVRNEDFWPPRDGTAAYDPYAVIIGTGQFASGAEEEEGEE